MVLPVTDSEMLMLTVWSQNSIVSAVTYSFFMRWKLYIRLLFISILVFSDVQHFWHIQKLYFWRVCFFFHSFLQTSLKVGLLQFKNYYRNLSRRRYLVLLQLSLPPASGQIVELECVACHDWWVIWAAVRPHKWWLSVFRIVLATRQALDIAYSALIWIRILKPFEVTPPRHICICI